MTAVLAALLGIVASYALSYTVDYIQDIQAQHKKVTPSTISAALNKAIAEARKKGTTVYNQVTKDLSKVQGLSNYATGTVRQILQQASSGYADKLKNVEEKMSDIENTATEGLSRAQDINYETTTSKIDNAAKFKQDIAGYTNKINDIEKSLSEV